jgi:hypothetical protein
VSPFCSVPVGALVTFHVFFSLVAHFCSDPCIQAGLIPNHHGSTYTPDACKIEEPDSNPRRMDANSALPLPNLHVAARHIPIPTTTIIPNDSDSTPEFPSIMGAKPVLVVQTGESFLGFGNLFAHWMVFHERRHQCAPMIYRAIAKILTYLTCLSALTIFLCPAVDYMEARPGLRASNYRCHASLLSDDIDLP